MFVCLCIRSRRTSCLLSVSLSFLTIQTNILMHVCDKYAGFRSCRISIPVYSVCTKLVFADCVKINLIILYLCMHVNYLQIENTYICIVVSPVLPSHRSRMFDFYAARRIMTIQVIENRNKN